MARRRFFVDQVRRGTAEMHGEDAEHLVRVLRAEVGQQYEISDNQHLYLAEITTARKSVVSFQVIEQLEAPESKVKVNLVAALFKFDHFEWMIEKATELGVDAIQPFEATRTERGLAQASQKRIQRWQRIVLESSQQSRRVHLPEMRETVKFHDVLNPAGQRLLLDEDKQAAPILSVIDSDHEINLLLGPEGGWTEAERQDALNAGWKPCSLGINILRAETAAISALAVVSAASGARAVVASDARAV